jgi:hypothetical protein
MDAGLIVQDLYVSLLQVTYVRGYDIAEQELVEARRRYDELLRKGRE